MQCTLTLYWTISIKYSLYIRAKRNNSACYTEGNLPRNRKVESLIACITLVAATMYFFTLYKKVIINNNKIWWNYFVALQIQL